MYKYKFRTCCWGGGALALGVAGSLESMAEDAGGCFAALGDDGEGDGEQQAFLGRTMLMDVPLSDAAACREARGRQGRRSPPPALISMRRMLRHGWNMHTSNVTHPTDTIRLLDFRPSEDSKSTGRRVRCVLCERLCTWGGCVCVRVGV